MFGSMEERTRDFKIVCAWLDEWRENIKLHFSSGKGISKPKFGHKVSKTWPRTAPPRN
jgi:hypothetical protein